MTRVKPKGFAASEADIVYWISVNNVDKLEETLARVPQLVDRVTYQLSPGTVDENILARIERDEISLAHVAAFYESLECLVFLCQVYKMKIDILSTKDFTPLHYACINGCTECATYLLSNGADPNKTTMEDCFTPLFLATCSGNAILLDMLFDYDARLTDELKRSRHSPLDQALKKRKIDCLEVLLSRGFKPSNARGDNLSPLMQAIAIGMYDAVEPLLKKGADPNFTNNAKNCAMQLAFKQNRPDIIELLMSHGGRLDFQGAGGLTAMHAACQTGNLDLIKRVVELGLSVNTKDAKDRIPTFTTLTAPLDKMIPVLSYLIDECHLDVNAKDKDGTTVLMEILTDKNRMTPALAEFLLSRGANLNDRARNGETVYQTAMKVCKPEIKPIISKYANGFK